MNTSGANPQRGSTHNKSNATVPAGATVNNNTTHSKTPVKNATTNKALGKVGQNKQVGPTVSAKDAQKWDRVQAQLKARLGNEAFASWFGRCRLEMISKSQLTLSVPTTFLKSWIRTHYKAILLELWQEQIEDLLRIDVVIRSAVRSENAENGEAQPDRPASQSELNNSAQAARMTSVGNSFDSALVSPIGKAGAGNRFAASSSSNALRGKADTPVGFTGSPLDPNFTFSTFVEGKSNRMACAAARSVAEADGAAARFNPLFIHANVGLGKTHLLQAIAWAANARNSGMKILYLTAEYFMWRFASAIRDQSALSFKESLRDIDLLLIDDMQFLQGKSIQQEFCHLLNALWRCLRSEISRLRNAAHYAGPSLSRGPKRRPKFRYSNRHSRICSR